MKDMNEKAEKDMAKEVTSTKHHPKRVVLMIADISGYTKYMLSNRKEELHGQVIITELIKTIIKQVKIPIEVAKLEGDAIFLYATKQGTEARWERTRQLIGGKLVQFFEAFYTKLLRLHETNMCKCGACSNSDRLRLKMVVHSGDAVFYRIGRFHELSGVDVVTVHRLLKNSLDKDHYILMTDSAYNDIEFPEEVEVSEGEERYVDVGRIKTYTYYPPTIERYFVVHKEKHPKKPSWMKRVSTTMGIMMKSMLMGSPENRGRMSKVAFLMLFLAIFMMSFLAAGIPLFIKWRMRTNLAEEVAGLTAARADSRETLDGLNTMQASYDEIRNTLNKTEEYTGKVDFILESVHGNLIRGVKLTGILIEGDNIVLTCLATSQNRLSSYVSALLDNSGLEAERIEKTGSRRGQQEYRITVRRMQ